MMNSTKRNNDMVYEYHELQNDWITVPTNDIVGLRHQEVKYFHAKKHNK